LQLFLSLALLNVFNDLFWLDEKGKKKPLRWQGLIY
jgi:hypothetical protein